MVSIEDLKKIRLLQNLKDEMLEKIPPLIEVKHFKEKDMVFKEGDKSEYFFMLKQGKILLEVEITEIIIISLGSIKSGYSFGWSALLGSASHASYAVCSEPCEVLAIPGERFLGLLNEDHTMGYQIMQEVSKILKNRLERRTGQFIKVMSKHPDIQTLLGL